MAPSANCPTCAAALALTPNGSFDVWICPSGHGVAATVSELHERAQEDEIGALWQAARDATPSGAGRGCPMCARPMVSVVAPVDGDEVPEGSDGDGDTQAEVPVDVCVADQVVWFDASELDAVPADLPEPAPTPEQEAALADIRRSFGEALEDADEARADLADRMIGRVVHSVRAFDSVRG